MTEHRSWLNLASSGLDYVTDRAKQLVANDDENKGAPGKIVGVAVAGLNKGAVVMKQVSKHGQPIFKYVGGAAEGVGMLAMGALAIPVALDAYRVCAAVKKDHDEDTNHNAVRAGMDAVGGWCGVTMGAAAGAAVAGPVGIIAGSVLGAWAGLKGANSVVDRLPEKYRS